MMPDRKRPVSVEDLLRLKRSERPAPEFWTRFDRELRAKQLAALVEKRPWWQRLPSFWPAWRRPLLTFGGASAALVVALVSLREDPRPASSLASVREQPFVAAAPVALRQEMQSVAPSLPQEPASLMPVDRGEGATSSLVASDILAAVLPAAGQVEEPAEGLGQVAESPSARSIAANLAAAQTLEGVALGRGLIRTGEPRASVRTVASAEPLAQMSAPADVRRARYRSALATALVETSVRTDERMARSLSDERMNDGIRRFNAKGDRLSVKF